MKKYLVDGQEVSANSITDAVRKVKDAVSFPQYVGTPSMSPDIMYQYIDYAETAIKSGRKNVANKYIDKLVSYYYDYEKLEDDFKDFINRYSKALNDVHTKMRALQQQVYQMKDSIKDIPVGFDPKVETRRIISWKNIHTPKSLKTEFDRYTSASGNQQAQLQKNIIAHVEEVRNDYNEDKTKMYITQKDLKEHYSKYNDIINKVNAQFGTNFGTF